MRNLKRLGCEIKIIENLFGYNNISYPKDGSWIKIKNYRLPQHKCRYNLNKITALIIIPCSYDNSSISECYIDRDLRIQKGRRLEKLPHTHDKKYDEQGYNWLCFENPDVFVGLLDFLNTLKLYFTDPFIYQEI